MAVSIAERMKAAPDTVNFFAACAAQFTGETSICSQFDKAGYRIAHIDP